VHGSQGEPRGDRDALDSDHRGVKCIGASALAAPARGALEAEPRRFRGSPQAGRAQGPTDRSGGFNWGAGRGDEEEW
jgi:hypothetical protein